MSIENFRSALPDFAKDIKLNLASVLTQDGSPDLTEKQILSIALASAFATRSNKLISALQEHTIHQLNEDEMKAAKSAATIMAMNNIYYRFTHEIADKTYNTMPAKLRMTVINNSGMDQNSFELLSLAVSAINGCGKCINAHAEHLEKNGVTKLAIQSSIRIASVIHAAAIACEIG